MKELIINILAVAFFLAIVGIAAYGMLTIDEGLPDSSIGQKANWWHALEGFGIVSCTVGFAISVCSHFICPPE